MSISDRHKGAAGFTLIELLIVIAIAGLVMSLVGGLALDRLEKAHVQGELYELERLAQGLGFRAFAAGRPVTLHGDGSGLSWRSGTSPERALTLKFWFVLPPQDIVIDAHGVAAPAVLSVSRAGTERRIAMNAWLEHGR